jgi:nicotinamidase-related amidase
VREGWSHGYSMIVAEDASTTFSAAMQDFPMKLVFPRIARVRSVAEIVEALGRDDLAVFQDLSAPGCWISCSEVV